MNHSSEAVYMGYANGEPTPSEIFQSPLPHDARTNVVPPSNAVRVCHRLVAGK